PRATLPGQPSAPIDWVQDAALAATGLELLGVRDPALTGRDPTLAWLWRQAVEARKAPTATTLALVGPEGSGRRRCARWLARQLHVDGGGLHTVVDGEVPEPPALLASVLGCATDALRTRLHGLHALSAQVGARLALLLDPTTPRDVGLGLALGILGAVARQVPVTVVLVDVDLHPGRLRLASRDVAGPVLFVVTAVDPPPHTPSHALPPLSPETLHRLLGSWAPLHWRTASAAVEASAGCPGRLVRWVRGQALTLDADGRLVPAKDVPDTVARVLEAHDAEATVLGLLGPAVPREAPAAVLERLGIDLGGVLVQAERAAHLEASPAGWAFRTAGLADAYARAERGLDPTVLRACADILDAAGCADRAVDLALLAGDLDRAVDLFTNRLSWSRTVEQIEDFARRLTSLWDGPPTEALHGQVRLLLARNAVSQVHPDAPRHLADLEALAAEQGWTLTAAQCVKLRHVRGDASIDEVVDAFDAAPSGALRDAFLVQNLIEQSSPDRLPGALDLARELGSRQLEEGVLSAMAHVAGDVRTAALHARERANHIETSSRAYVLVFAQHLLVEGADYTGGLAVGREAIAWCRLVEQPQALLVGLVNQAICHARLEDWESAARTAGYALALPRQPVLTELCRIVIAIDAARAGRPWPARELLPVVAAMRPAIERLGGQARWLLEGLETAAQRKSETR
ncbi:MAG: hypothetical protein KC656_19560, partial [Myxococcales bacterium]|nr:hypothetical protein [Myxococcales bacterium]